MKGVVTRDGEPAGSFATGRQFDRCDVVKVWPIQSGLSIGGQDASLEHALSARTLRGGIDLLVVHLRGVFQWTGVRHGHFGTTNSLDWCVKFGETRL